VRAMLTLESDVRLGIHADPLDATTTKVGTTTVVPPVPRA
jgi:hypothetical protein